ncbi:Hypothetical protein, putative [Bodo saltans]|uniref:Uncharacterized protein n=1 Tax=Bodo saltans TaxID=75058 RepID=A0A0S4JBX3_BODSA|nr:Hypothetical protein, putative [Bodo saltans]|eukprot:CUG87689.1 Hypothetical protein, putative [Bodo saltans]
MGASCSLGTDEATVASLPPLSDDFDFNSDDSDNDSSSQMNGVMPRSEGGRARRKKAPSPPFQPPPYISLRPFHDDRFPEEDPAMRVYYNSSVQRQQVAAEGDELRRRSQPEDGGSGDYQRRASGGSAAQKLQAQRSNSNNPLGACASNPLEQSSRPNTASATQTASAALTTSATLTVSANLSVDDGNISRVVAASSHQQRHRQQTVETPAMLSSFNRGE